MPGGRGTHTVAIRVPEGIWEEFGNLAEPNRTKVLIEFMRWYVRQPEAKLPRRPPPTQP